MKASDALTAMVLGIALVPSPLRAATSELVRIDSRTVTGQRYLERRLVRWRELGDRPSPTRSREAGERAFADLLRETILLAHADHLGLPPNPGPSTLDGSSPGADAVALTRFLEGARVSIVLPRELRHAGVTPESVCSRVSSDSGLVRILLPRFRSAPPGAKLVIPEEPLVEEATPSPASPPPPARRLLEVERMENGVRIRTDGRPHFRTFELAGPARFVLDLEGLICEAPTPSIQLAGRVHAVRVGQFRDLPSPIARVVFDLAEPPSTPRVEEAGHELLVLFLPEAASRLDGP